MTDDSACDKKRGIRPIKLMKSFLARLPPSSPLRPSYRSTGTSGPVTWYKRAGRTPLVTKYFSNAALYWDEVYSRNDVKGQVYRNRQEVVVNWALSVAGDRAVVADVGAGAGHLAARLAQRGLGVVAIDASDTMLDQVASNAKRAGVAHLVTPLPSEAQQLRLPSATFDVVTAVGLLPWVDQRGLALAEMARVTKPGGHVIATMDNAFSLSRWLDPGWHTSIRRLKERTRQVIPWRSWQSSPNPSPDAVSVSEFNRLLREVGLVPIAYIGVGFGPFTFFGRAIVPNELGLRIDRQLQGLADRQLPCFRHAAVFHVVLATKPDQKPIPPVRT
jgi:ubiquinone/menaquinone biosynthesis C-methylase UbiE